jgi:hypothetical protein
VNRSVGLFALLALAILSIVGAVAITRPVRVEQNGHSNPGKSAATRPTDGGSLDSLLDTIHLEHGLKHGR